jgi:hypothetical protein
MDRTEFPVPASELRPLAHAMMEAIIRGDADLARQVFHPDATITGQQDGILVRCGVAHYIDFCRRLRLPRRRVGDRYRLLLQETTGPIGFFKLHETYPDGDLTTYMTASKLNGRWLVNNRTLYGTGRMPLRTALTGVQALE